MRDKIIQLGDDFWNVRGSFRIFGFVDIGTQASLVRLRSGKFVILDSYTLAGDVRQQVMDLTDNGAAVEAVINLHPFHTVHCANMQRDFPDAKHYGTARHEAIAPDLYWQPLCTETSEFHEVYSEDLSFSVPRGVQFVTSNDNVHFSSVLACHPSSRAIHSDDTLMYLRLFGLGGKVSFHPTLSQALERRAGAAADFRQWARDLVAEWSDAEHLCAAHSGVFTAASSDRESLGEQILAALDRVAPRLDAHTRKYG